VETGHELQRLLGEIIGQYRKRAKSVGLGPRQIPNILAHPSGRHSNAYPLKCAGCLGCGMLDFGWGGKSSELGTPVGWE
jgi:hypothetical protein